MDNRKVKEELEEIRKKRIVFGVALGDGHAETDKQTQTFSINLFFFTWELYARVG